jgi:hypothetical protein
MKKMDILQIVRVLALIGGTLLSLAILLLIFTDFLVKKPKKEEQKIEDAFGKNVYGFYKDGKWIKYEELVVGEKALENNNNGSGNVAFGYSEKPLTCNNQTWSISSSVIGRSDLRKNDLYKPIKLEEWQIIQIKDAKEKGFAGIEMTINNNQTYISFHNTSNQSTGSYNIGF